MGEPTTEDGITPEALFPSVRHDGEISENLGSLLTRLTDENGRTLYFSNVLVGARPINLAKTDGFLVPARFASEADKIDALRTEYEAMTPEERARINHLHAEYVAYQTAMANRPSDGDDKIIDFSRGPESYIRGDDVKFDPLFEQQDLKRRYEEAAARVRGESQQ